MKSKDPSADARKMLALLTEVIAIARTVVQPLPKAKPGHNTKSATPGIYPHQSKYNPWRVEVWDTALRKSVYLGAFPTIAKAKAAIKAYRAGLPVVGGTKAAHAPAALRRVA